MSKHPPNLQTFDSDAFLQHAAKDLSRHMEQPARRMFLRRGLTLGGLSLLSGCTIADETSAEAALMTVSRWNDKVQGWLFDPNRLAPTYADSMITRPFPFNAFYGEDEIRHVDGERYRLEVTGLVADRHPWSLQEQIGRAHV